MNSPKRMQSTPLGGSELELVKGILMDAIAAIHAKNPADNSTELVIPTHFEKGDVVHLRRALKNL